MIFSAAEWTQTRERRVPVERNRVACGRIGSVAIDRCQECPYLLRLEVAGEPRSAHVVCADSDFDTGFDYAW